MYRTQPKAKKWEKKKKTKKVKTDMFRSIGSRESVE